jgi:hypothetical protein
MLYRSRSTRSDCRVSLLLKDYTTASACREFDQYFPVPRNVSKCSVALFITCWIGVADVPAGRGFSVRLCLPSSDVHGVVILSFLDIPGLWVLALLFSGLSCSERLELNPLERRN